MTLVCNVATHTESACIHYIGLTLLQQIYCITIMLRCLIVSPRLKFCEAVWITCPSAIFWLTWHHTSSPSMFYCAAYFCFSLVLCILPLISRISSSNKSKKGCHYFGFATRNGWRIVLICFCFVPWKENPMWNKRCCGQTQHHETMPFYQWQWRGQPSRIPHFEGTTYRFIPGWSWEVWGGWGGGGCRLDCIAICWVSLGMVWSQ